MTNYSSTVTSAGVLSLAFGLESTILEYTSLVGGVRSRWFGGNFSTESDVRNSISLGLIDISSVDTQISDVGKGWQQVKRRYYAEINLTHDYETVFRLRTRETFRVCSWFYNRMIRWQYDHISE